MSLTAYRSKRHKSEPPDGKVAKKANLSGAPPAPMPTNVAPMLAGRVEKPQSSRLDVFEIKWDGYRAIAEVQRGSVRLYSRNLLSLNERFPSIAEALTRLDHDAVLDGERRSALGEARISVRDFLCLLDPRRHDVTTQF